MRFAADLVHQGAAGHPAGHDFRRVALNPVRRGAVFGSPQFVNGIHVAVGKAQQLQDAVREQGPFGRLAQDMQSGVDFAVFQFLDIVMERGRILFKGPGSVVGDILLQFGFPHQVQDGLIHVGHVAARFFQPDIFVQRLFQFRNFVVGTGIRKGRRQIADQAGCGAALGNHAFAGDRHMVRVDVR